MLYQQWQNWSTRIFAGLYESYLYNSDTLYNVSQDLDDDEPPLDIDDWDSFAKDIGAMCVDSLRTFINDDSPIKSIRFDGISSPTYYNFETDRLICTIGYEPAELTDYCFSKHRKEFGEYLQENFTSRSDFISFVPNTLAEFWQDRDAEKCIDVMLEFVILQRLDDGQYEQYWQETADGAYDILWLHLVPEKQEQETENKGADDDKKEHV